jgi:hypothetical protein
MLLQQKTNANTAATTRTSAHKRTKAPKAPKQDLYKQTMKLAGVAMWGGAMSLVATLATAAAVLIVVEALKMNERPVAIAMTCGAVTTAIFGVIFASTELHAAPLGTIALTALFALIAFIGTFMTILAASTAICAALGIIVYLLFNFQIPAVLKAVDSLKVNLPEPLISQTQALLAQLHEWSQGMCGSQVQQGVLGASALLASVGVSGGGGGGLPYAQVDRGGEDEGQIGGGVIQGGMGAGEGVDNGQGSGQVLRPSIQGSIKPQTESTDSPVANMQISPFGGWEDVGLDSPYAGGPSPTAPRSPCAQGHSPAVGAGNSMVQQFTSVEEEGIMRGGIMREMEDDAPFELRLVAPPTLEPAGTYCYFTAPHTTPH